MLIKKLVIYVYIKRKKIDCDIVCISKFLEKSEVLQELQQKIEKLNLDIINIEKDLSRYINCGAIRISGSSWIPLVKTAKDNKQKKENEIKKLSEYIELVIKSQSKFSADKKLHNNIEEYSKVSGITEKLEKQSYKETLENLKLKVAYEEKVKMAVDNWQMMFGVAIKSIFIGILVIIILLVFVLVITSK